MAQGTARNPARKRLINIRVSPTDRNVIDRAARTVGKSRSEFMLEAARRAAQDTLLDTTLVLVDAAAFARFKKILDAPPRPNKRLRALMRKEASWDHDRG